MTFEQRPSTTVRTSVVSLFAANGASFLIVGLSYVLYSRYLTPADFGLYSAALAIAAFGTLVLDGGLKNTIIKARTTPTREEQGTLLFLMMVFSLVLVGGIALLQRPLVQYFPAAQHDYLFLALFASIYLLSYPFLSIPTAFLERRFEYKKIAVIESVGLALERASPIVFLLGFHTGIYAFTWGLLLGRVFRMILVNLFYRASFHLPSWGHVRQAFYLVKEGTWLQVASGAAFVRDNLHVLLVGPLFGSNWVGYYGWGLQLSLIASQVFVQISARVSVPMFAQTATFERRWQNCLYQIRLLAMLTAPILIAVLLVLPGIDDHFFLGKWRPGISILPLLFLRMLPGLATTPLGALLMVERGGKRFATANVLWAALEVAGAALLLHLLGPTGLAWSYATVVWIGLAICLAFLGHNTARLTADVAWSLLQRPSLIIGSASLGALVLVFAAIGLNQGLHYQIPVAFAAAVLAAAYLSESYIRKWILALLRRREVA